MVFFKRNGLIGKIKILLLFLYLKTLGRVFVHIAAHKHPLNHNLHFARYMGKIVKKEMIKL